LDSYSRHNEGAYNPGGFMQHGNFASPSVGNQPIGRTNSVSYAPQDSPTITDAERDQARNWFVAIDQDGNEELSYEELHHALLTNNNRPFSANTVKYLVSLFDRNGDGVIGSDEFVPLWVYLNKWIWMFDSFDGDRDGRIDTAELGLALANYGVHVGPDILDIVMKKYGEVPAAPRRSRQPVPAPSPRMDLDQFVCACVSVREMCKLYVDCSAQGQARIRQDVFLKAVLALP
jgi:Ca2+-binding EF-hand superfamily protein